MSILSAIQAAAALATRGVPAIRSAVSGARLGAGAKFARSTIETLGVRVAGPAAAAFTPIGSLAKTATGVALREVGVQGAGVTLRITPMGGVAATVSEEVVMAAARSTARGAFASIGRATALGALGGAALDAIIAGVEVAPGLHTGTIDRRAAALHVGKRAARGAAAGAAGVAAAGAVSAAVAVTGITFVGTPIVVPLAAMVAAGALVSRAFDRRFGV